MKTEPAPADELSDSDGEDDVDEAIIPCDGDVRAIKALLVGGNVRHGTDHARLVGGRGL